MSFFNEIATKIENLENELHRVNGEIDSFDAADYLDNETYDDFLRDTYGGEVEICGMTYDVAEALKCLDIVAYDCGKLDFVDSMEVEDMPEYRELVDELDALISDCEDVQSEVEDERDALDEDDESYAEKVEELNTFEETLASLIRKYER